MNKKKTFFILILIISLAVAILSLFVVNFVYDKWFLGMSDTTESGKYSKDWSIFSALPTENGLELKIVDKNLMFQDEIKVEADSIENESTQIHFLYDGITDNNELRWSSDNDWEDNEHWIQVSFPNKTTIGSIRLYWERLNAKEYALEASDDGITWKPIETFEEAPNSKCQDIVLNEIIHTHFLCLHIFNVAKSEEDGSLYYQNISLLELEVYPPFSDSFEIIKPIIKAGNNRILEPPFVPSSYKLEFIGCDYEQIIDLNGNISDTLSETTVDIGYRLIHNGKSIELPALTLNVPASEPDISGNILPKGYSPMEWKGTEGNFTVKDSVQIFIPDISLQKTAELLQDDLLKEFDISSQIISIAEEEIYSHALEGDILIKYSSLPMQDETFLLSLGTSVFDITVIEGSSLAGLRYGCTSFVDLLTYGNTLPKGTVKDYPRYKVRGFGIDVARRPIPITMLYSILETMSKEKMNTLHIHLNDNQILALSEHNGTIEGVLNLYSGFRLESTMKNANGIPLTSTDLYYSKDEFRELINTANYYGISIVPEIDTPAHSLSIIKLFPELGLQNDVYTADQLNLADERTFSVVREIWDEYLIAKEDTNAVFSDCKTVHIGMDEYYGNNSDFGKYLLDLSSYINETSPDKTLRMWGSFSNMDLDYSNVSKDIQVQIWNTEWADPHEMYNAGYNIINSQNTCLYIIPGSGYDWLDNEYLSNIWEPNVFTDTNKIWTIPTYSSQMLGACYMLWNDMIYIEDVMIKDDDIYERFKEPLPVIADKLWN